jgi:hypothetical protein
MPCAESGSLFYYRFFSAREEAADMARLVAFRGAVALDRLLAGAFFAASAFFAAGALAGGATGWAGATSAWSISSAV